MYGYIRATRYILVNLYIYITNIMFTRISNTQHNQSLNCTLPIPRAHIFLCLVQYRAFALLSYDFIECRHCRVSMGRVGLDSGRVILFYYYVLADLIKFGSKNLNPYPTRSDPCKIIKYLLIIFI
jgi:hypothetical protein